MPIAKDGHILSSLEEWKRYAPPKSPRHWVDGRSAKELARAWLAGGSNAMPPDIVKVLVAHPSFSLIQSWDAEPEAKLKFDTFAGEPRNSDLAVWVRDNDGPYLLAVEAKADEPYGETVEQCLAAALERRIENPRSNGIARVERLASSLLSPRTDGMPKATALRYQLLTACAGAAAEAHRKKALRAVILIHEFITSKTVDANHARNAVDLCAFLSRLTGLKIVSMKNGQLYGPFEATFAKGVRLFIGKVSRNLREADA